MNFDTTLQTAKRATVGKSALGWVALACLILNGAFWGMLMLDLLAPASLISPQALQAGLAIVAFALILPLFWSMLLPSSPAGRLLQRQQWATPGYVATSAAACFLTWMAGTWLRLWWQAQPGAVEAHQDLFLTITSLIAGVLVPALAWCVTTPEQWIAAIEQARHVKRIEHAMKMEEAAMRAAYARAVSLLHADLTNLTIEQRRELAGILGGFARMQQQSMQQIAASWKDMYGVECQLATIPDQQLLDGYQQIAGMLAEGGNAMAISASYAADVRALGESAERAAEAVAVRPLGSRPDRAEAVRPNDAVQVNEHVQRTSSGPAADHRTTDRPPHPQAFDAAWRALSGAWTRQALQEALDVSKTQAHTYIRAWLGSGHLNRLTEPQDHYAWRDR
jgi:hypothetical protein